MKYTIEQIQGPFTLVIPIYAHEFDEHPVKHQFSVTDLDEASRVYQRERDKSGLGSRQFGFGSIMKESKEVGHVSYNGRVWLLNLEKSVF